MAFRPNSGPDFTFGSREIPLGLEDSDLRSESSHDLSDEGNHEGGEDEPVEGCGQGQPWNDFPDNAVSAEN
jgi:hypothetical protein